MARSRISLRLIGLIHHLVQIIRRMHYSSTIELAQAELAFRDSQEFIYQNSGPRTLAFRDTAELRRHCLESAPKDGALFEFGVFRGNSINAFARQLIADGDSRLIFGFDSFSGFSEPWSGRNLEIGVTHFDLKGNLPAIQSNVQLVVGFIEESLPKFLTTNAIDEVAFVHIDTDTYSPAKTVLTNLKKHLRTGSIVLFDEICGFRNWRSHEFRALSETFAEDEYDFIGFAHAARGAELIKGAIRIR